jgi:hypothetical protein
MSLFWYEVRDGSITMSSPGAGVRTYTEEDMLAMGWGCISNLVKDLGPRWEARTSSLPADATEQAEIDAAKCQPAHVEPLVQDAIRATYEASKTPEPKRAKLPHFNQRTRFNPFKGFKVTYEGEGTEPASFYSKPEQRMNEGGNALHGSAFLLV